MKKTNNKSPVNGWVILDKPLGLTSTQALGKVRRLVGGNKAGHGGTLDPLATGVLPLAFGEATKLIPFVLNGDKVYEFTVRWGEARTTDDREGDIISTSAVRPDQTAIQAILSQFTGEISQTPPLFSAIKLDGKRAYDLARAGERPEIQPRKVSIKKLELVNAQDSDVAQFRVFCGKGTYVRALARDIGQALGCYGFVEQLRRVKSGPFGLESSFSLENLEEMAHKGAAVEALLEIGSALDDIPGLNLTASEAQRLRTGQSLLVRPDQIPLMELPVILASFQGVPVALVKAQKGSFCVVRGFNF